MTFVERSPSGAIKALYCKLCRAKIGFRDREGFKRTDQYAEVKIRFDDGSHHVTNGCQKCLRMGMDMAEVLKMYEADCQDDPSCRVGDRVPVKVVSVSYDQGGIL